MGTIVIGCYYEDEMSIKEVPETEQVLYVCS